VQEPAKVKLILRMFDFVKYFVSLQLKLDLFDSEQKHLFSSKESCQMLMELSNLHLYLFHLYLEINDDYLSKLILH
jgi:hypothetical protein